MMPYFGVHSKGKNRSKYGQNRVFLRCQSLYLSRQWSKIQFFLLKRCAKVPIFTSKRPNKFLGGIGEDKRRSLFRAQYMATRGGPPPLLAIYCARNKDSQVSPPIPTKTLRGFQDVKIGTLAHLLSKKSIFDL